MAVSSRYKIELSVTSGERTVEFSVDNCVKIIELRSMIEEKMEMSLEDHNLMYQGNVLDEDKTVEDGQIIDKGVVNVVARVLSGTKISFQSEDGKLFKMRLTGSDRIGEIKKKIRDKKGILPEDQFLSHKREILTDDRTLEECKIDKNSLIKIVTKLRKEMTISVSSFDQTTVSLVVDKSHSLRDVKSTIFNEWGLSQEGQVLMYNGKILHTDRTLEWYQIGNNDTINVVFRKRIPIDVTSWNGSKFTLEVVENDRIIDVKKEIKKRMTDHHVFLQRLTYKGVILNNMMTIADCHIDDGTVPSMTVEKTTLEKPGICLIISNEDFISNTKRVGTKKDEKRIKETFVPMEFKIKLYRNVSKLEMVKIIEKIKRKIGADKMLIVFILSHGDKDVFITPQGDTFLYKDVWSPFTNDKVTALTGKPKLFFFGCCLGSHTNLAIKSQAGYDGDDIETDAASEARTTVPAMADIFLGFSTCESYVSYRNIDSGTYYIQHLCDVIDENPDWSVSDIHQEVQKRVSLKLIRDDYLQMPSCQHNLTEHAYFMCSDRGIL